MPDHPEFLLNQIKGRSMVQVRVRLSAADLARKALGLPDQDMQWGGNDPAFHMLGPDQYLFTSDQMPADDIISHIDSALSGELYSACDMSSAYACFELKGQTARTVLAMGCGIDMHESAFETGHCTRTYFAGVMLFIVATQDDSFNLYVDRSFAHYLSQWIASAGGDPLTHSSKSSNEYKELA